MKILGIETSCDDTAMAILEIKNEKLKVLANVVSSQVKIHKKFGGVVPFLAAREHTKNISRVFKLTLKKTGISDIDLISVTRGPGLGPSLLTGITFAKTIAWLHKKPILGVNHLEGHIYSNWLPPVTGIFNSKFLISKKEFPILNLIVSGGHTELVLMKDHGKYQIIGETLDDAAGEAFDKVARLLELGYPGGPAIAKIAGKGDPQSFNLPRPMLHSKNFNFSYSGLKTAVLYLLRDLKKQNVQINKKIKADIAASFQEAAIEVLIQKTKRAVEKYKTKHLFLSGGVSANKLLREKIEKEARGLGINFSCPPMEYTTDNAAMIAVAGYFSARGGNYKNKQTKTGFNPVKMDANLGF
ncbi:MAG: tRNA (adenosine(37)-N6)-threonylcarbamoyltransferase complex transferase subunit TsaD [Candidatus Yanofskybacteria bacterium CG10_big_fil_rev_8_21_14_0_10_37_15]|uniref:tRNA N6-adenosine threonylcarbamoyltransferase n=1 Tax=Candidatus Yanofskybacteria bacterium CG10_big_fil_rev_8_21_14_0_10_37_15 TaxID=1975097 RepID=A0A2H0R6I3_9BACT|nr:MAG: tRNA (adenosine(37)-N6)-threonylcarbamoyltransferase complex transferase subunit TsaD [Candidatus Yanofskybacteria bacterium CG10_big_fil_rev_8_21_14_0_10_37_15]